MQHVNKLQLITATPQASPKVVGSIKLKDGTILSLSDLPAKNTSRWVASAKAAVVRVFMAGLASRDDLIARYNLSQEEFDIWLKRYVDGGKQALKITNIRPNS